MRMMSAFALPLAASGALADDVEDAHKLALQGATPTKIASRAIFAAGYQGHVDAGFLRRYRRRLSVRTAQ